MELTPQTERFCDQPDGRDGSVGVRCGATRWPVMLWPLLAATLLLGCKNQPDALAELIEAAGPVERLTVRTAWRPAVLGTRFYLGDAARTAAGAAQLRLADTQRLAMDPHTVLRFGRGDSDSGEQKLLVELGAVSISGDGAYQFNLGDISVARNGGVRISAGDSGSRVELLVGQASIRPTGGELTVLQPGLALEFANIEIRSVKTDARDRRLDAGTDAGTDAGVPEPLDAAAVGDVAIVVAGRGAEVRRAGDATWRPLPAGPGRLEGGAQLRTGRRSTAALDNGALDLALGAGGVAAVGPQLGLSIVRGSALVRSASEQGGAVEVPGGGVSFKAQAGGASAEITVATRDSSVRVTGGEIALLGKASRLEMRRGESATLGATGNIRVLVAVPSRHDIELAVGETATIHDPRGATAVQFRFAELCPGVGVIELDPSGSFRTPQVSAGRGAANVMIRAGSFNYRLRCEGGGNDGASRGSGRVVVVRDAGQRPLPAAPPPFQFDVDGRTYRVGYQGSIPAMKVGWKGAVGTGFTVHVARGGKAQVFTAAQPEVAIAGNQWSEGTYSVWFEKGAMRSKVSTLIIDFDNTAPALYIDEPDDGDSWGAAGSPIEVKGAVLPGWTSSIEGVALPLDKQRRFRASVPAPSAGALAVRLSHPQRGIHYYLRRPR